MTFIMRDHPERASPILFEPEGEVQSVPVEQEHVLPCLFAAELYQP